ncbi:GNAT family N-acetyltransferase [Nostoc sphaeroides]|uniref:RimJ, [ribosomal protein S5]-alanine N-acetyltransferase n=1 Tax=Nostoc sphaeroides CCNUC1 TaxID=2653204 RepID=A0A5P8WIY6_9NOSO|nr:GNAT family N-acetyltransferase [Nostoc sphaeroides]QFS52813.1 rimJ [ribosomal protein S5]-alanine N-acetyltransferase [Nostoc sphaeroides CCNUC1]
MANKIYEIPVIETARLVLTLPDVDEAPRLVTYIKDNVEHLAPWSPPRPEKYYTEDFWREKLLASQEDFRQGKALELVLFSKETPLGSIVGQCSFTGISRGPFQACYLGYNLDYRAVGHGYMFEALTGAIAYVFDDLKLHRIMANYIPTNERSAKLLRRLNFLTDGYSRDYLFIAGRWQDHVLTSLTNYEMTTVT